MKKILAVVFLAGWFVGSYATDARVYTMGGHDNFFMDDYSIFRNPANINYYPNMLIGSPGVYEESKSDTTVVDGSYPGLMRKNTDPKSPYFGPILSYSLNQSSEAGAQYPLLSVGIMLNRYDEMLDYLDPSSATFQSINSINNSPVSSTADFVAPVGKIDFMLGYAMQSGAMIGAGGYFAMQRKEHGDTAIESNLYRGNVGLNYPIGRSMNLEVSAGVAVLKSLAIDSVTPIRSKTDTVANNNVSFRGDLRLFSALNSLNGDLVPHFGFEYIELSNYAKLDFALGLGVNVNIDKGFFWAGVEGLYQARDYKLVKSTPTGVGGRISAGLERNMIFDWWVWRIGVSKSLLYVTDGGTDGHWEQNPENDGSNKDCFALGWGLNIENRLKVDVVLAEDMFYTFSNLISGSSHHLTNRITCTYSF